MQFAKQISAFAVAAFCQMIVSCGQNVQDPEYSHVPGSSNKSKGNGLAGNQSADTKTYSGVNATVVNQNAGGKNTIEASISGTAAQVSQQPQTAASSISGIQKAFSEIGNAISGIPINSKAKSTQTPSYGSAFSSQSFDPSIAYNSNLDLGFSKPSSNNFPDYSSAFNSNSPVNTSTAFNSNLDLGFKGTSTPTSAATSSSNNCRTPTRAAIILNNC